MLFDATDSGSRQRVQTPFEGYQPTWEKTGPWQRRMRQHWRDRKRREGILTPDGPDIWWDKSAALNHNPSRLKQSVTCKFCSKIGHEKRHCPRNSPNSRPRCHFCHQLGHKVAVCPKLRKPFVVNKEPKPPFRHSNKKKWSGRKRQLLNRRERSERAAFAKLLNEHLRKLEGLSEVPTFKVYMARSNYRRPPHS